MNNSIEESSRKIMQFITAKWISHPLYVVSELGIADILSAGPKTVKELAKSCNVCESYLYRIMRALSCVGIFYENADKEFDLTPMAECLQKDKMRPIVLMFLSKWHNKAWDNLSDSVKTGDIAFDTAFGMSAFDWLKDNPEEADIFNEANAIKSKTTHAAILDVYNFSRFKMIVDLGGGYGGLLFKILHANENLKGTIADLSYMIDNVNEQIINHRLSDRCSFVPSDFFADIPAGGDCYILSNILHDWDDEKCLTILKNCYDAISNESKLLIIESIIPPGNDFGIAKLLDLEVLVMGGGKERTEVEFRQLLNNAGFSLENIIHTQESVSIIECRK